MKKWLGSILCGAMALTLIGGLVACGGGETSSSATAKKTHDAVTLQVTGKDTYEPHNFVDGKCTMCDETTVFTQDPIGGTDIITKACDQQGTIEKITYTYHNTESQEIEKTAYVYLPYGYNAEDTSVKYDVLYMLHGKGLNEGYWLAQGSYSASDSIYTKGYGTNNVLDNMMKAGTAKKTICVTPTYYLDENETQDDNFGKELTEDLMPYIAEHYNTYAADSSAASLKANRDHQGYVGLSLGSMYSFSYIWTDYLDYFSYIGSFSGSSMGEDSWEQIVTNKNTKFKDLSIKYWYVGLGTSENSDTYPGDPFTAYRTLVKGISSLQSGSDLSAGDNCEFVYCNKTGHNYATWITCLYNCMQVFFKA